MTSAGVVDVVVSRLLLAVAVALGWENRRNGVARDSTGPQPGYPETTSAVLA